MGATPAPGKVSIPAQTIKVGAHHHGKVKLKCTGQDNCAGVLRITITIRTTITVMHKHRHRHVVIVLGRVTFSIKPGKTTSINVKLRPGYTSGTATIHVLSTGATRPRTRAVKLK